MISSQQLGERLADARRRAGLTQAQLAERVGLSRTTVVAVEKGERRPSNAEMVKLAEAVGAPVNELLRESAVRAVVSPRLRTDPEVALVVERLRGLGARYVELERLHGLQRARGPLETLQTYRVEPGVAASPDPEAEGEDAARVMRAMLGLGDEPALGIDERFEAEAGLRIFYLDELPPRLAALLLWTDEIGACVAVHKGLSAERQRWSLVHEVGHFLRDRELGDVLEQGDLPRHPGEVFPEAFAKEFLLPTTGVQKRFAERCRAGKLTPVDVHVLAKTFGVSFQAMTLRLEELRLLPKGTYGKIVRGGVPAEEAGKGGVPPSGRGEVRLGLPDRYVALAVSAFDQALLSEGEFADMIGTDVGTARLVYQQRSRIILDDGTQLAVDFTGADLRVG